MCGIFGIFFGKDLHDPKILKQAEKLKHRGKDGLGVVVGPNNDYVIL